MLLNSTQPGTTFFPGRKAYLCDGQSVHQHTQNHAAAGDHEQPDPRLGLVNAASSLSYLNHEIVDQWTTQKRAEDRSYRRWKTHKPNRCGAEVVWWRGVYRGLGYRDHGQHGYEPAVLERCKSDGG